MSAYSPDVWVIVELDSAKHGVIRKVLGGWYGGYAGSDSWRLSSGITGIVEYKGHYEVQNESGSVYKCYKSNERTSMLTESMFRYWEKNLDEGSIRMVPLREIYDELKVQRVSA